MKKILHDLLYLFIGIAIGLIAYFGYNFLTKEPEPKEEEEITVVEEVEEEPEPLPEGAPDIIGLYKTNTGSSNRILVVDTFTGPWTRGTDINTFNAVYSNEEELVGSSVKDIWTNTISNYLLADDYKVGYEITLTLTDDTEYKKNILSPKDTEEHFEYLEIYLYDSYHVTPGTWYSHLLENQMKDETIITSIKLTPGTKISEVKEIKLKTFVYKDDNDFDPETNEYIGQVSYEIDVIKQ